MAEENQVLISELQRTTEAADTDLIPIDNGTLTKAISVGDFNAASNQTAKAYAEAAADSAQTAADTVANINAKVDQAQGYANSASQQAGYAQTYAGNAETYAGNAQGYANTAQGHANNASASATSASSSADAASNKATLAQSWAEGNTGAREGENTNNARYWANKAQTAAQITIDDHLDPQSTNPVENQAIYDAINSMHTGGSNIEITTTQSSLYGKNVTISDGTTTLTAAFDLTGKALFEGVLMTGDLTITSTDGTSTATGTLTVPYFGNYTKAIAFWQATIAVTTTTSQFNGLTVSAKKNGAVVATGTFSNGSASIVVPEAGTYKLEVTLDWQTYESSSISVTEETTYNETLNGFIAPISLTTPTTEFYGGSIAVTLDGTAVTPATALAFDNTGAASFTALKAGTYVFTLTYGGEPYTASVTVSAETSYSAVIKMWTATVNISTSSTQLQSQSIDVYKGSAKVGTTAFNASGQASYLAHESGTYHFVCTVDGYPFTSADVAVSAETTYSTTITYFAATLSISTSSSDLYSQPITIKKGSTTVGTTAFSSGGSASYVVHETGEYTAECEGYSGSATVSAETTYSITINAGLDLSSWITAGSTTEYPLNPSSYADFSALEADEAAVRQLMLVHDAVDYLATASAGDSLMESVIGSDICAKWINLSDYALDTLYANSDIADEMDTADKYGYGELACTKSLVPTMTGPTTPSGEAFASSEYNSNYAAWKAFNGDTNSYWVAQSGSVTNQFVGYDFGEETKVYGVKIACIGGSNKTVKHFKVQYSNTSKTEGYVDATETLENPNNGTSGQYPMNFFKVNPASGRYWRVLAIDNWGNSSELGIPELQFLAYEPLGNVPIMTANNAPYGVASASSELSSTTKAYYAFDGSGNWTSSTKPAYVQYQSISPICIKKFKLQNGYNDSTSAIKVFQLLASNNGSDFSVVLYSGTLNQNAGVNLEFDIDESKRGYYLYHRIYVSSNYGGSNNIRAGFQLYGRELTVKQASAPTDGREYIQIGSNYYTEDWGEKEFATSSTRKTIYDHGVAPSGAITGGTKNPDCLTLSAVGTATVTIDKGSRTYMGGKAGLHASGTNRLKCGSGYSAFTASNMPDSNGFDISSISGSVAVGIEQTASGTFDCTEIWIE